MNTLQQLLVATRAVALGGAGLWTVTSGIGWAFLVIDIWARRARSRGGPGAA